MVTVRCHAAMMTSTDMMRVMSSETTDGQIPMTTAVGICGSLWGFVGLCEDTMGVAKTTSKTKAVKGKLLRGKAPRRSARSYTYAAIEASSFRSLLDKPAVLLTFPCI
jgi:hypothetical protein